MRMAEASITGYEPRKQFAIGLTVEQIAQVYWKAATAIEKRNQQKFNKKKTYLRKGRSQIKVVSVYNPV
jgi:hypothetical protein